MTLDKQKRSKRSTTVIRPVGNGSRPQGPGIELLLTILHGMNNDIQATKQALPLIIAYIESTTEDNRLSNWKLLVDQGRLYRPITSDPFTSFTSISPPKFTNDDGMDIDTDHSDGNGKSLTRSSSTSSRKSQRGIHTSNLASAMDIPSNRSSPMNTVSPTGTNDNTSFDASNQPRYTVTTHYLTEAFRAAQAFLAASGYNRWTEEDVREHNSIEQLFRTMSATSIDSVLSSTNSSLSSASIPLQRSTLSAFLLTIPFHGTPINRRYCYYEKPWSDHENTVFTEALDRHNKAFTFIARTISTKSTQECVNYYYYLWRLTEEYEEYKKRKDRLGKFGRFDVELRRRDRAWLHYWRFDVDALGPPLPPAQAYVPDALRVLPNSTTLTTGSIEFTSGTRTVTFPSPAVPLNTIVKDKFALPLLTPALPVVVTAEGIPLPASKSKSKDPNSSSTFTNPSSNDTTVRSGGTINSAFSTYLSSSQLSNTSSSYSMVIDPSDPHSLVVPRPKWENMTNTQLQMEQERIARNLRETQYIDPLNDYARILRAAGSALKVAALEVGVNVPSEGTRLSPTTLSTNNVKETHQSIKNNSANNFLPNYEPYPTNIVTTYAHSDLVSASYPLSHQHDHTKHDEMTVPHVHEAQQAIALANRSHVLGDPYIEERFIDNESFCGICGDGGDMICCDGPCRRSFHISCLRSHDNGIRAAIKVSPALQLHRWYGNLFTYERDDWCCYACISGIHECFICGNSGHDGFDIFRCQRMCGKWYHLSCLAKWPSTKFYPTSLHGVYIDPSDTQQKIVSVATPAPLRGTNDSDRIECTTEIMQETMKIEEAGRAAIDQNSSKLLSSSVKKSRTSRNSTKTTELDNITIETIAKAHVALKIMESEASDKNTVSLLEDTSISGTAIVQRNSIGNIHIPPGTSPRFSCPLHICVGCNEKFHTLVPTLYMRCHACPSSYHLCCVPKDAQKDMNEIITCSNTVAHDAKKMTPLYRQRSGVSRIRPLEEAMNEEEAAARRRDALVQTSASKSNRMGDAFMLRLRTSTDDSALINAGKRINSTVDTTDVSLISQSMNKPSKDGNETKNKLVLRVPGPNNGSTGPNAAVSNTVTTNTFVSKTSSGTKETVGSPKLTLFRGARLSHIEANDSAYREEILRRAKVVAETYPIEKLTYLGVVEISKADFAARIHLRNYRTIEVGRFESARIAAVAHDYALTYYNQQGSLNFPGTVSSCIIDPPIDPLPPRVNCAPGEKIWSPLPGEEEIPVYFHEKPEAIVYPKDQVRLSRGKLINSMNSNENEQKYRVNSINDIYAARTKDELEKFINSEESTTDQNVSTGKIVNTASSGTPVLGKRTNVYSNNNYNSSSSTKVSVPRKDVAIQLMEGGPYSTYLGVYASQSHKVRQEQWLAKFNNRVSIFDIELEAAIKYDTYLMNSFAKGEITREMLINGTNFAIDPVVAENDNLSTTKLTKGSTIDTGYVTRQPLCRLRLVLYDESSEPIIVELNSSSYLVIPPELEEKLYPILYRYGIVNEETAPSRLRAKLLGSDLVMRNIATVEQKVVRNGKLHPPIRKPLISDFGLNLSSPVSTSPIITATNTSNTTVNLYRPRTRPRSGGQINNTDDNSNTVEQSLHNSPTSSEKIGVSNPLLPESPIITSPGPSNKASSSETFNQFIVSPDTIVQTDELIRYSNSDLLHYAGKLSRNHPEINETAQAFKKVNSDIQNGLPASLSIPLDVDAATRAAADEWRKASAARHGELEKEVANLTGIKSELLFHLWRNTPQWETARPRDAEYARKWLQTKCITRHLFIEMRKRAGKPLPKILTVFDILPFDSSINGNNNNSSSTSSSSNASSLSSNSSIHFYPDNKEIIDGKLNPDAHNISKDTSHSNTLVIYNNDGLYLELDPITLQPHLPFHYNNNVVYECLGTTFFDESFEPLDVPVGLKLSIIHTSYLQPALRCVYVVESLLRSIQPNSSTYAKYVEIRNNDVIRRAYQKDMNNYYPVNNYPYPKAPPMNKHIKAGEPVAIRAWGLRMRNPIDHSNVGFEGLSLSQVWLTTAQAINFAQTAIMKRYQGFVSETTAQSNVIRDRLIKIFDTISTQKFQRYNGPKPKNDESSTFSSSSSSLSLSLSKKIIGTPTAPIPPLTAAERATYTIPNYINLSRTAIERFGLPPFIRLMIRTNDDGSLHEYGVCRHETCLHNITPKERSSISIVRCNDENGVTMESGTLPGRFTARSTHLWRHELLARKHLSCSKECRMCMYLQSYLLELQGRTWDRTPLFARSKEPSSPNTGLGIMKVGDDSDEEDDIMDADN